MRTLKRHRTPSGHLTTTARVLSVTSEFVSATFDDMSTPLAYEAMARGWRKLTADQRRDVRASVTGTIGETRR